MPFFVGTPDSNLGIEESGTTLSSIRPRFRDKPGVNQPKDHPVKLELLIMTICIFVAYLVVQLFRKLDDTYTRNCVRPVAFQTKMSTVKTPGLELWGWFRVSGMLEAIILF
jgi:hypothetical protein